MITYQHLPEEPAFQVRHVYVGSGARFDSGFGPCRCTRLWSVHIDHDTPLGVHGNVHVQAGGDIYGCLLFRGNRHTFFRIDGAPESLGHSLNVEKDPQASVLFVGERHELVRGGGRESRRFIVGVNSTLGLHAIFDPRLAAEYLENCKVILGHWMRVEAGENALHILSGAFV
ncbi:MAG: hypothetical protein JJU29_09615 [Verrucomicrobia bacterium]|nr:hypothetical protein [Verrucomicrobiota bacterium]